MNLQKRKRRTDRKRTHGCWEDWIVKDSGKVIYLLLYLKWDNHRKTYCITHGTLLSIMCLPEWEGAWGKMDKCMFMVESLCCASETITALLTSYTPIENVFSAKKINFFF